MCTKWIKRHEMLHENENREPSKLFDSIFLWLLMSQLLLSSVLRLMLLLALSSCFCCCCCCRLCWGLCSNVLFGVSCYYSVVIVVIRSYLRLRTYIWSQMFILSLLFYYLQTVVQLLFAHSVSLKQRVNVSTVVMIAMAILLKPS